MRRSGDVQVRGAGSVPRVTSFDGLRARAVRVTLGDRPVLDGVDLDVARGEIVLVRGASGAGKSPLLRALVRVVALEGGTVTLNWEDVSAMPAPALRRRVGLVAQTPVMLE